MNYLEIEDTRLMSEIRKLAIVFRQAIMDAKNDGALAYYSPMKYFPRGCCEVASDMLAEYLRSKGIETHGVFGVFYYNNGADYYPHEWLALQNYEEIIIDITGDQFYQEQLLNYYDIPVYMGTVDDMHSKFKITEPFRMAGKQFGKDHSNELLERQLSIVLSYLEMK